MRVKICGLSTLDSVDAAVNAGAAYVGFVFFPKSPRNVSIDLAAELARAVPEGVSKVALLVNPSDVELDEILGAVSIDMIQLHGSETPERVAEVKERFGLPVMKAVGVADKADLDAVDDYAEVADQILLDAKAPKGADLPGGNGVSFDWSILAGRDWSVPWMLAGGLTPDNVGEAVRRTGATQVDLSSGVEDAPGVKSIPKIKAMLKAAKAGI